MVYPIAKITIAKPIKLIWVKDVIGLENIPKKGAYILAANHSSYLDPLVLVATIIPYIDRKIHFIAKTKGSWGKFFGDYITIKWCGCIPMKNALKTANAVLTDGEVIGIFPEGTRSPDGNLIKARTSIAVLALENEVPVIPIGVINSFRVWPKQQKWPKLKKNVTMKIGKPIYFKKHYKDKITKGLLTKITRQVMKDIGKLIGKEYKY